MMLCHSVGMTQTMDVPRGAGDQLFDTPILLSWLAELRDEWLLSPSETQALVGAGESQLRGDLAAGRPMSRNVERRIRLLRETSGLVGELLPGGEAPGWLRAPCPGLRGASPLRVMSTVGEGLRAVRDRLRAEREGDLR